MTMKVKICGIRTMNEAQRVLAYSPDALGVIVGFPPGIAPNNIPAYSARDIVYVTPEGTETFLLTYQGDYPANRRIYGETGGSAIQYLGDIPPDDIRRMKDLFPHTKMVKVVHVTGGEAIATAKAYERCDAVDELLLYSKGDVRGGAGRVHNWHFSRHIVEGCGKPVWLAGGLRTENLREAIDVVRPHGVDVETGVQNPTGTKNYREIERFIYIARSFD